MNQSLVTSTYSINSDPPHGSGISPADKPENHSLFDKSTEIGMHVTLIVFYHLR